MLRYQDEILKAKLVDTVIDVERPIEGVISDLKTTMGIAS
jgi:hypothetical protein